MNVDQAIVRRVGIRWTGKQRESADFAAALTRKVGDNYYQGTVGHAEVQRRRARNRVARVTRAAQRRAARR